MKGIGYFVGVTIGAVIMFTLISILFLRPRKVTNLEIEKFVKNNTGIKIKIVPLITVFDTPSPDDRLGIKTFSKTTYFSNKNMQYEDADTYTYFCKELNKYVRTYVISEGGGMGTEFLNFGKKDKDKSIWPDIYAYYNKEQNADRTYGTLDKPLPILFFKSSDPALRSMRPNNKDADPAYLKDVYDENVKLYLEYFIDKNDFNKLFPDK